MKKRLNSEFEYDNDEIEMRKGTYLNARMTISYYMDGGEIDEIYVASADMFSDRRDKWVKASDSLCELLFSKCESKIIDAVEKNEIYQCEMYRDMQDDIGDKIHEERRDEEMERELDREAA